MHTLHSQSKKMKTKIATPALLTRITIQHLAYLYHDGGAPARADPLDPLANLLKEMILYMISYHAYILNELSLDLFDH